MSRRAHTVIRLVALAVIVAAAYLPRASGPREASATAGIVLGH